MNSLGHTSLKNTFWLTTEWTCKIYPSTHNLGSVKNWCISCSSSLSNSSPCSKLNHDYVSERDTQKLSCLLKNIYIYIYKIVFGRHHFVRFYRLKYIHPFFCPSIARSPDPMDPTRHSGFNSLPNVWGHSDVEKTISKRTLGTAVFHKKKSPF